QAVNPIIEHEDFQANIAPKHVDRVVAADREGIAVAGHDPNLQIRAGDLEARRDGWRTSVDCVKTEGVHIVGKTAGTPDTGNNYEFFPRDAQIGKDGLNGRENRVVSTARTPTNFLIGLKVFF